VPAMSQLEVARDQRNQSIKNLLNDIKRTTDKLPLSVEDIVTLIEQHLACKNSARLPVLLVAVAYQVASEHFGAQILELHPHNAADKQTGAAGDLEITLVGDDDVVTAYEMKMRAVTVADINAILDKIKVHKASIEHYVFVTTEDIDPDVRAYAANLYEELGGVEIAILGCVGFLRHFLHLFHRLRTDFLNAYQGLVLSESDSAVSHALKEAFLSLRKTAEGAK